MRRVDVEPCPQGPCEDCEDPCPSQIGIKDGVYEQRFQETPGYRNLIAVFDNVRIARVEIPLGTDCTRAVGELRGEISRRKRVNLRPATMKRPLGPRTNLELVH